MDSIFLGALVAFGGMLLVCGFEEAREIRDRRRIAKRQRVMPAARLRSVASDYAEQANASRNVPAARIRRAALNTLATDLLAQARRLENGAR